MKIIELTEYVESEPIHLDPRSVQVVKSALPRAEIRNSGSGYITVNPRGHVGTFRVGTTQFILRPKLPLSRVMFMLAYSGDPVFWRQETAEYETHDDLVELICGALSTACDRMIEVGVLHDYEPRDDSLNYVRGAIRLTDQLTRHQRVTLPLEVRFDEFTVDNEWNRLVVAGIDAALRLRPRASGTRRSLRAARDTLGAVSSSVYSGLDIPRLPVPPNHPHYEVPMRLAELLLRCRSQEIGDGGSVGFGLVLEMSALFESFIRTGLRTEAGLSTKDVPDRRSTYYLDDGRRIALVPDVLLIDVGKPEAIGETKYRDAFGSGGRNRDLYQTLAYLQATQAPLGVVIYPTSEVGAVALDYSIVNSATSILVRSIDLFGPITSILAALRKLAQEFAGPRYNPARVPKTLRSESRWRLKDGRGTLTG